MDSHDTYQVDSYSLLGLRAGWSQARWNVFADLVNATDQRYVSVIGVHDIAAARRRSAEPRLASLAILRCTGALLAVAVPRLGHERRVSDESKIVHQDSGALRRPPQC